MRDTVSSLAEDVRLAQYVMGTIVEVTVRPIAGETHAREATASALREFERIERIFSRFDPRSELCHVNRSAAENDVVVSGEFAALLSRGLQYTRHCAAAFSVCLQPLVNLWEKACRAGVLPAARDLDHARLRSRPDCVIFDERRRRVRFSERDVGLNFDGLAKGYAVDRARAVLCHHGITQGMINAGSSSIALLRTSNDLPWILGVRRPRGGDACVARIILKYQTASTSATGERGATMGGRWRSHVIDPDSGCPITNFVSATVAGDFAELMEVASKIVLLRGCRQGLKVCDQLGWVSNAVVVKEQDDGLLIEHPDNVAVAVDSEYDSHPACVH